MDPHPPANGNATVDRKLWASAALNSAITLAEFIGGLPSCSLALLSDAVHNAGDVLSLGLAIWARRVGRKPATYRHTYGFRRAEVIAALVNAVVLLGVIVLIAREAIVRFLHPEPVAQGIMLGVGIVALLANAGSVLLLHRHEKDDVKFGRMKIYLQEEWGVNHVTLEPEVSGCGETEVLGQWP